MSNQPHNTQVELRNILSELQNRTVSAFTSRRYEEQNIIRDEYQEAINAYINKQIEEIIGEDDIQQRNDDDFDEWVVCSTCDCILSDETEPEYSCQCTTRNTLRAEQRQRAKGGEIV